MRTFMEEVLGRVGEAGAKHGEAIVASRFAQRGEAIQQARRASGRHDVVVRQLPPNPAHQGVRSWWCVSNMQDVVVGYCHQDGRYFMVAAQAPRRLADLDVARGLTRTERTILKRVVLEHFTLVAPWLCHTCPECDCGLPPQRTLLDEYWQDGEE